MTQPVRGAIQLIVSERAIVVFERDIRTVLGNLLLIARGERLRRASSIAVHSRS
jgi:hypothetical protein